MRRYFDSELMTNLTGEAIRQAGDELRNLEVGPAWFRLQQIWADYERDTIMVMRKPTYGKTLEHYAEASGRLHMLELIRNSFDQILSEAKVTRDERQ